MAEQHQHNEVNLAATKNIDNEANRTVKINDSVQIYGNESDEESDSDRNSHVRYKTSKEHYLQRMGTLLSLAKQNQEKIKYEKVLTQTPGVIWYLANRYGVVRELTWSEYIRHYLPYPLVFIISSLLQSSILVLIEYEYYITETKQDDLGETDIFFARFMAIAILFAYILKTGQLKF